MTPDEWAILRAVRAGLGLSDAEVEDIHEEYGMPPAPSDGPAARPSDSPSGIDAPAAEANEGTDDEDGEGVADASGGARAPGPKKGSARLRWSRTRFFGELDRAPGLKPEFKSLARELAARCDRHPDLVVTWGTGKNGSCTLKRNGSGFLTLSLAGVLHFRPRANYVRAFGPERAAAYVAELERLFPDTKGKKFPGLSQNEVVPHASRFLSLVDAALAGDGPPVDGGLIAHPTAAGMADRPSAPAAAQTGEASRPATDDDFFRRAWLPRFGPEAVRMCRQVLLDLSSVQAVRTEITATGSPGVFLYGTRFWIVPLFTASETDAALTDSISGVGARKDDTRTWSACAQFRARLLALPGASTNVAGEVTVPLAAFREQMPAVLDAIIQLARELGSR